MTGAPAHEPSSAGAPVVPDPLRALPEDRLIETWNTPPGGTPLVSVVCMAYNHVATVGDAIEGILAQRTSFPFEVLVQDDASTDGTAAVIAPYARSHPRVVTALLRTENLYSRNGKTLGNVLPLARGRWIAVCEADDYWSDPGKLQTQFDALQRTGAALSLHPAVEVDVRNGSTVVAGRLAETDSVLEPGTTLLGRTPPYAAAVYSRAALDRYASFRDAHALPLGDVFMMAIASVEDGIAYVDRTMSVYRRFVTGSWTATHTRDHVAAARHGVRMVSALEGLGRAEPSLRRAAAVRRRRVWWHLVWSLRQALAARQLTRGEAARVWPTGQRAPLVVQMGRAAVLVLPVRLTGALRNGLRRLLGRR